MLLRASVKNSVFSTFGTVSNFVIGILFAGLTIRYLGESRAGYFLALQAILGMNSLVVGQVFRGPAIQRMAQLFRDRDWTSSRRLVGVLVAINLMVVLPLACLIVCSFAPIFHWSRLDAIYRPDAFWATLFCAGAFVIEQVAGSFRLTYDSHQRFDLVSLNATVLGLLTNLARLVVLKLHPTMAAVAAASLAGSLGWLAWDCLLTRKLLHGWCIPNFHLRLVRPMMRFGLWTWLGNLGGFLCGNLDRIVLTSFLGSAALPYYAVPQRVASQIHVTLAGQLYFLFPMLSGVSGDVRSQIRRVEDRLRWFIGFVSFGLYAGAALTGPFILTHLVSADFAAKAYLPLLLACVQGFFMSQILVYFYTTWAIGEAAPNVVPDVVTNTISLLSSVLLIPGLGYLGASVAQLWRVPFAVWHTIWCRRILGLSTAKSDLVKPYASILVGAIVGLGTYNALAFALPLGLTGNLLWTVVGLAVVVACVWGLETRLFADRQRWSTAMSALNLIIAKCKGLRIPLSRSAAAVGP